MATIIAIDTIVIVFMTFLALVVVELISLLLSFILLYYTALYYICDAIGSEQFISGRVLEMAEKILKNLHHVKYSAFFI